MFPVGDLVLSVSLTGAFVHHSLIGGATGFRMIRDCLRFAITLSLHSLVANQQV
jgi:hypothetical protein